MRDVEREGEFHCGASSRGGSGPTAAYHYGVANLNHRRESEDEGESIEKEKIQGTYPTTFLTLSCVQSVAMPPPTYDFVECKRYASVRRRVDLELCVECGRLPFAPTSVTQNGPNGCRYGPRYGFRAASRALRRRG